MKQYLILMLCSASAAFAQVNVGELRLQIVDPHGLPISTEVQVHSAGNQFGRHLKSDAEGHILVREVPYGS